MAEYKFSCPNCGQHLAGGVEYAGREIVCPACAQKIRVPAPPPGVAGGLPPLPPGPPVPPLTPPPPPPPKSSARREPPPAAPLTAAPLATAAVAPQRSSRKRLVIGIVAACGALLLLAIGIGGMLVVNRAKKIQQAVMAGQIPGMPGGFTNAIEVSSSEAQPAQAQAVANVTIPEQSIAGTLKGKEFTPAEISYRAGVLHFTGEGRPGRREEILIFPFLNEKVPTGRTVVAPAASNQPTPHIHLVWNDGTKHETKIVSRGYTMRLEFGEASGESLKGRIYLEIPGDESKLAGSFEAAMPQ